MSNVNKEQFNLLAKKILEILVDACPLPAKITAETLELPKGEYQEGQSSGFISISGSYKSSPEEKMLKSLLKWLVEERFIRAEGDYYVATLQTLKLYNSVPNAIAE
ncbi:MAG: hypothetical protein ACRES5_30440 [Pseudomonas sp.]